MAITRSEICNIQYVIKFNWAFTTPFNGVVCIQITGEFHHFITIHVQCMFPISYMGSTKRVHKHLTNVTESISYERKTNSERKQSIVQTQHMLNNDVILRIADTYHSTCKACETISEYNICENSILYFRDYVNQILLAKVYLMQMSTKMSNKFTLFFLFFFLFCLHFVHTTPMI